MSERASDHRRLHAAARQRLLVAAKEKGFAGSRRRRSVARARDLVGQYPRPPRGRAFPGGAYAGADADRLQSRPDPAAPRAPSRRWRWGSAATPSRCRTRFGREMVDHGATRDLDPATTGARAEGGHRRAMPAGPDHCASPSCIRIRGTTTSCAIGLPPAASTPTATSRSSSCRRR